MTLTLVASAFMVIFFQDGATNPIDKGAASAPPIKEAFTEAERITKLQRSIESDEERLAALRKEYDDPDGEYGKAKAAFEAVDQEYTEVNKSLRAAREGGLPEAEALAARLAEMEKPRALAKERFDLAIEERKLLKQKIATSEQKLSQEREALDKVTGEKEPAAAPTPAPTTTPAPAPEAAPPAGTPTPEVTAKAETSPTAPVPPTIAPPALPSPATEVAGSAPATALTTTPETTPAGQVAPTKELVDARADAQAKADRAKLAEKDAQAITDRMEVLEQAIAEERKQLGTTQRKADNASESRDQLAKEIQEKWAAGATPDILSDLNAKMREAEERFQAARKDVRASMTRLDELQSERGSLQAEQLSALREAEAARSEVAVAEKTIRQLQNPFALQNVLRWVADHGPKLLVIALVLAFLHGFSRVVSRQIVRVMSRRAQGTTKEERENRAKTLVGVFENASAIALVVGGALMMFQEIGIPIAPLMGGAAALGLAVAFGAQNLIRDYFYGFVILLENQFTLNDVVKIGEASGQVELITLRMTVLRDIEGCVHFIPNGEITSVTNMTYGWSRAMFEVGVAYKEDADRVIAVIKELGAELRRDPLFGLMILDDLTMLGVDALADSAVVIKFYIKTRPLQQWAIRREMLRRVKRRFDDLGIEIPFPHRTVFHRLEEGNASTGEGRAAEPKSLVRLASGDWKTG